ncbi:MAG: hypothetical protein ABIP51_00715 [Bacteroidia bacterium]
MEQKDFLQRFDLLVDIQETIFRIPFLTDLINSFLLQPYEDYLISKKIKICFELKEKLSFIELNLVHCELAKQILLELEFLNRSIKKSIRLVSLGTEPAIEFYSRGDGPFRDPDTRIRNSFISKI